MRQTLVGVMAVAAAACRAHAFQHGVAPPRPARPVCRRCASAANGAGADDNSGADFARGLTSAAAVDAAAAATRPAQQQRQRETRAVGGPEAAFYWIEKQEAQAAAVTAAAGESAAAEAPAAAEADAAAAEAAAAAEQDRRRPVVRLDKEALQVGGMDHVVEAIRRRVWVPLCAPDALLSDLGIAPVSGLLLHGPPGCGKSLLARRLAALLSPRPPSFVSGPEVMDRFVGSSEENIRTLFKYPPKPIAGTPYPDEALHVIVLDEFDAIAGMRSTKGGGDSGERVRDSIVNQLLACMDGVQQLTTRTLIIGLTNRRDLIDPALLRPGRFEVHIEVSHPDLEGRAEILRIHTQRMWSTGRMEMHTSEEDKYAEFLQGLASRTDGFSGAELAGVVRAAAAYALDRAASGKFWDVDAVVVTRRDFEQGLADVTPTTACAREQALAAAAAQ